ncbi:MAG: alkaline phosphatase family protein [Hyphomonadaceae bacterium]|nr:MAG: alkaline phosphatase D [Caulobacteraceae bacterium]MBT9446836.1 alkaline phosphatase family protein [Hyphomonadaceae bacterium]TPW03093.1 MAG: alkaline phosphatase D [Alphaproteobacteria bacterium]
MTTGFTRRGAMATAGAAALVGSARADEAPPLTRIALGACGRQNKEQPIWDAMLAAKPEFFVFLGDCVYGDTHDPAELRAKYQMLADKPGFKSFREATPFLTVWDDHDYGKNDSGANHPTKNESRAAFCDFWEVPADSPRRTRPDGVYTSTIIGPPGREVQIIVPDLRWNRTKLRRPLGFPGVAASYIAGQIMPAAEIRGPYAASRAADATMLGEAQWAWLEEELKKPAALRLIGSTLQVLAKGSGWEGWENYPADVARLHKAIGTATNVILLSGDVHYGEISKFDREGAAPLWELTSSGITESDPLLPNKRRVKAKTGRNFGVVEIDWEARTVDLQVRDEAGATQISERVAFG